MENFIRDYNNPEHIIWYPWKDIYVIYRNLIKFSFQGHWRKFQIEIIFFNHADPKELRPNLQISLITFP